MVTSFVKPWWPFLAQWTEWIVQDLCMGRYSPESQPAETTLTVTESIVHLYCARTEHQRHITQQPSVFPLSTRRLQPKCFQLTINSSGHRPTAESHTFAAHKPAINCPMSLPSTALNSQHPLHNAKFTKLPQALQPKQVCVQPLHMLTKWHCPHRPVPTAANLPLRHGGRMMRQTYRRTSDGCIAPACSVVTIMYGMLVRRNLSIT